MPSGNTTGRQAPVLWRIAGAALLLAGVARPSAAQTSNIIIEGLNLGSVTVSNYVVGKNGAGTSATANIDADYANGGITVAAQNYLNAAPFGLTWMQTVLFTTNLQQQIFRSAGGANLTGTFSDPPQGGYMLRDGTVQNFGGDLTPYYSSLNPAGTPGALPPNSFPPHQMKDTPSLGFGVNNGFNGLANVLNGMNGTLLFETALVNVFAQPADSPMTAQDERLTDIYAVQALKGFTWGFNFTFVDDGVAGFTGADYTVAALPITFSDTISTSFRGAFDKAGANSALEWNVAFVPEPGTTATGVGMAVAAVVTLFRVRRRRR